ncbi:MAG: DUF4290 domain-containing protein [Paludibacteraceae bacterium]|nr:DUF4290 domain-containing protein [Paludibacteraceae bacterium]
MNSLPKPPKDPIKLTEYGRNIQKMVEYAMTIEDKAERTRCVNSIIDTMGIFFPHLRDVNDFKHKLWDHLAIMSDYKLDIDYPYDVPKEPERVVPNKVAYPTNSQYKRHYGKFITKLVQCADKLEGEDRERYIMVLANHMKRCYMVWNKDVVDDATILGDLCEISGGKINLTNSGVRLKTAEEFAQQHKAMHSNSNAKKSAKRPFNNKKKN